MKLYDRWVEIYFEETADGVSIIAHFDFETENTHELPQDGWQAILNHFKQYVEPKISVT